MSPTPTTANGTSDAARHAGSSGSPAAGPTPAAGPAARPASATGARRRVPRWTVPLVAAVVAAVLLPVGAALGIEPVVRSATGTQAVGVVAAAVAALVVGYAAWGVRALLGRMFSRRPRRGEQVWLVTCGVVLLVSLLGPLGGVTAAAVVLLAVEHVAVGAVLALGLRR